MAFPLPLAPRPVCTTLVLLPAAVPPFPAAGARGYLPLPTAHCLLPTAYCLLPTTYCSLPTYYSYCLPLTHQVPEDASDAATAAAIGFGKRTRTDAGARRAAVRASSIFEERRATAEEEQRLQMLQMRRSRGIKLAPAAVRLPPPRHTAARVRVTSGDRGAGRSAGGGGGAGAGAGELRAKGGGEVGRRREGESANSSSAASSSATTVLPPPVHSPAAQEAARGSGPDAAPQGKAVSQGLVAYSDSDSEGEP